MNFTHIKETCLYVKDLEATEAFYHGKLGLPVIGKRPGAHVFFRAGSSVLLCFNPDDSKTKTALPPHWGSGALHMAFECQTEDYEAWKAKLAEQEIPIVQEYTWFENCRSCYFNDPDGHVIEIVQPGLWDGGGG
ncbi:VOC family protein [Pontibacter sp. G13]|uniref:VOC family protein n=1 Tax=Pontibacter sp. G13 TaxID=3074898 RepID=UPI00288AD1D8|nr:VOC family protein [Pontibacter sp. G13]WNJ16589.1 VOC family protein [Pontibacter sp. G13]